MAGIIIFIHNRRRCWTHRRRDSGSTGRHNPQIARNRPKWRGNKPVGPTRMRLRAIIIPHPQNVERRERRTPGRNWKACDSPNPRPIIITPGCFFEKTTKRNSPNKQYQVTSFSIPIRIQERKKKKKRKLRKPPKRTNWLQSKQNKTKWNKPLQFRHVSPSISTE